LNQPMPVPSPATTTKAYQQEYLKGLKYIMAQPSSSDPQRIPGGSEYRVYYAPDFLYQRPGIDFYAPNPTNKGGIHVTKTKLDDYPDLL
ncbi:hypothetical protein, partial [Escherichia coli]|uniref:hypothetical protein n=1 Tax=Escherichia coli TaxID=562 RepID=UPI003CE51BCD